MGRLLLLPLLLLASCSQVAELPQPEIVPGDGAAARAVLGEPVPHWQVTVQTRRLASGTVEARVGAVAAVDRFVRRNDAPEEPSSRAPLVVTLRDDSGKALAATPLAVDRGAACVGAPPQNAEDLEEARTEGRRAAERAEELSLEDEDREAFTAPWIDTVVFLPELPGNRRVTVENAADLRKLSERTLGGFRSSKPIPGFVMVEPVHTGARAAGADGRSREYEVVVLGHAYDNASQLMTDFTAFREEVFLQPLFRELAGRIRFYVETRTGELGCTQSGRSITCDQSLVAARAVLAGRYDHIAVFSNTATRGGSAHWGPSGVPVNAYRGMGDAAYFTVSARHANFRRIAIHELAHVLGAHDEYTYDDNPSAMEYWRTSPSNFGPNCEQRLPATKPGWALYSPRVGCVRLDWYRPDDSIMKFTANGWYNTPTQIQLRIAVINRSTAYTALVATGPKSTTAVGVLDYVSRNEFPPEFRTVGVPLFLNYCQKHGSGLQLPYGASPGNTHASYFGDACLDWIATYTDPRASRNAAGIITSTNHVPMHVRNYSFPMRVTSCPTNPSNVREWGVSTGANHQAWLNSACGANWTIEFFDPRLPAPTYRPHSVDSHNHFPGAALTASFPVTINYCRARPHLATNWGRATGQSHYNYFSYYCGDFSATFPNPSLTFLSGNRVQVNTDVPSYWDSRVGPITINSCPSNPSMVHAWGNGTYGNHEAYFDSVCSHNWKGTFPIP